jgi:hypothetical protein
MTEKLYLTTQNLIKQISWQLAFQVTPNQTVNDLGKATAAITLKKDNPKGGCAMK